MPKPRRLGSSSSFNRTLSRLSSSSSSSSARKSNARIYTCLLAGAFLLFASVAFLQVHLLKAPHSSKLSPLENESSDADLATEAWWTGDQGGVGNFREPEVSTGTIGKVASRISFHRRMGMVQGSGGDEDGEGGEEEMDAGDELGDVVNDDEDYDDQDRFDVDIDDRELEEEADEEEDFDLGGVAENVRPGGEGDIEGIDSAGEAVNNKTDLLGREEQDLLGDGGVPFLSKGGDVAASSGKYDSSMGEQAGRKPGENKKESKLKRIEKLTNLFNVPDWVLEPKGGKMLSNGGIADLLLRGNEQDLEQSVPKKKRTFWDHAMGGVRKRTLENYGNSKLVSSGFEDDEDLASVRSGGNAGTHNLGAGDADAAKGAVHQLQGFKEVVESWKERFNSDDEPVDEDVQRRLEDVKEIEDALLLNGEGVPFKQMSKSPSKKPETQPKKTRGAFDPMNPANIPMLQDPDTSPGTSMTKSDKAMLRAMRVDSFGDNPQSPRIHLRGSTPEIATKQNPVISSQDEHFQAASDGSESSEGRYNNQDTPLLKSGKVMEIQKVPGKGEVSGGGVVDEIQSRVAQSSGASLSSTPTDGNQDGKSEVAVNSDIKQWGYYPGLNSSLSFSDFMDQFLGQESCSMKVFMAWTTPAWGFTARHQRALESLFRFHQNACVVVFSESFGFDFFKSFVKEGFKVAVVKPNLDELLADTPSVTFAVSLLTWRTSPLFYLHFTELLRLAALYKYGGIYIDTDVIVLKPLDKLHNTVGSEIAANGNLRLNGAVLAFNKSSLFLKKCMEEFTATYNDTSLEWNGADLLTRVANSTIIEEGKTWRQFPDLLKIEGPFAFFPLDSSGISKYFTAPKDKHQQQQKELLLTRIFEEAYTIHLWSRLTSKLVPGVSSLVGTILSRSCLRCANTL